MKDLSLQQQSTDNDTIAKW